MFRSLGTPRTVRFSLDGAEVLGAEGQTVAGALLALNEMAFRTSAVGRAPRGPYCLMGACFECLVEIDGRRRQSCLVALRDGMRVVRRIG